MRRFGAGEIPLGGGFAQGTSPVRASASGRAGSAIPPTVQVWLVSGVELHDHIGDYIAVGVVFPRIRLPERVKGHGEVERSVRALCRQVSVIEPPACIRLPYGIRETGDRASRLYAEGDQRPDGHRLSLGVAENDSVEMERLGAGSGRIGRGWLHGLGGGLRRRSGKSRRYVTGGVRYRRCIGRWRRVSNRRRGRGDRSLRRLGSDVIDDLKIPVHDPIDLNQVLRVNLPVVVQVGVVGLSQTGDVQTETEHEVEKVGPVDLPVHIKIADKTLRESATMRILRE